MGEGPTDESDSAAEDEAGMDVAMEDVHWDSSSTANTTSEEQPSDNENIAPSGDNRVLTEEMMGEAIAAAFELDLGYDEEKRHMFDDGLSGDDSLTHESDTSDIEEDEEQEPSSLSLKRIVREGSVQYTEESSFEYDTSDDDDESMDVGVGFPVLDVLQKSDIKLQLQGRIRDEKTLKVFELEESRLQIQEEIRVAQAEAKDCESLIRKAYRAMLIRLDNTVLSRELFAGYKMFCEFLQPEYGSREGFSITCAEPHTGSYVLYDPAFHLFKEHVELDYMVCNWRCEASVVNPPNGAAEYVVEFWPLQTPENLEADKQTWGRLFVCFWFVFLVLHVVTDNNSSQNSITCSRMLLTKALPLPRRFCVGFQTAGQASPEDGCSTTSSRSFLRKSLLSRIGGLCVVLTRSSTLTEMNSSMSSRLWVDVEVISLTWISLEDCICNIPR